MPMERRLAAILAADIVGYSGLIGLDEEGTLDALGGAHQRDVVIQDDDRYETSRFSRRGEELWRAGAQW
jgi:hypothetical protein